MKLNKTLICLVICFAILSQATAKKRVQKKTLAYQQIFGDWRTAKVTITGKDVFKFNCKIKDALDNNNKPVGILFDGFEQIGGIDKTGYWDYAQIIFKSANMMMPLGTIDFRLVQNCAFTDNTKQMNLLGLKNYYIEFTLNFHEQYNTKALSEQNFGNSLKVNIELLEASKDKAVELVKSLTNNCQIRNQQMTGLKKAAIDAGNNYIAQLTEYNNRQQTIDQQNLLINDAQKLVDQIKSDEAAKAAAYDKMIKDNEALYQQALDQIGKIAANKQTTEKESEQFSQQIASLEAQTQNLIQSQALAKKNLQSSESKLNEAIKFKQEQEAKKNGVEKNKADLAAAAEKDRLALEKTLAEIDKKRAQAQKDYEEKKKSLAAQSSTLNSQTTQLADQIKKAQQNIEDTKALIKSYVEQSKALDEQIKGLQQTVNQLYEQRNAKRTLAQALNDKIQQQQKDLKDREARGKQIADDNAKVLADLKAKELQQIQLIQNATAEQKKILSVTAEQANQKISGLFTNFKQALDNIVAAAEMAKYRTDKALALVDQKQHVKEITAVVSSTEFEIKQSLMRQAKYRKEFNRLAKLRARQAQIVRLQRQKLRKSLKSKLRHRLNRDKY